MQSDSDSRGINSTVQDTEAFHSPAHSSTPSEEPDAADKAKNLRRALAFREKYFFDRLEAKRAVSFFELHLRHVKGDKAGEFFKLQPWQRKTVRRAFGWKNKETGVRKYRRIWIEVPKGNGKTPLGAGFGLYLFAADKEPGAEVICAAADKEQASIAYEFARENAISSPALRKLVGRPYRRSMSILSTLSTFKVVSSEARTKHGTKIHGLILDEVHAIADREYVETLISGTAKRPRSMTVMLTTAGYDPHSICFQFHEHALKVRDGIIDDPELLVVIFAADEKDDWTLPAVWKKANPNFNITILENDLASHARMAAQMPSYENNFKRLFLNIWTTQDIRWLPMRLWNACGEAFDSSLLKRQLCFAGLDLASTSDIAALVAAFPRPDGTIQTVCRFWCPKDTALQRQKSANIPYYDWIQQGYMIGTEGNAIDFDFIRRDINELADTYAIYELAVDRNFNAFQIMTQLAGDGLVVIPFGQGFKDMTAPSRYLETLLLRNQLRHNNHPILKWMASNAAAKQDAAGNIKPDKEKSREKIDGIVSLVMALGRLMLNNDYAGNEIYNERGVLVL